ncbi:replication protein A 32 kDa subunit [Nematostella vectensis]|uniref:replication protein A 32 kDa subunit n=1 Tax=Nematostella vectensis TaxID=45351 RepID=UPI002076F54D|nr:replication protein A 32 kDa subunit [Nematostella vectensis]
MWNDGGQFGGGGYQSMNTSASFGGGGFLQDNQFGSPSAGSQEKKRSNRRQSVIPCTIRQLNSAVYQQAEDVFTLGNIELSQVSFIGVIRSAEEASTNVVYHVNDMTGEDIVVKKWANDNEETEQERERRAACRENTYVHVVGNLKWFKESKSLIAFSLMPLEDFNQLTCHILEVMQAHLALQKMPELSDGPVPMSSTMVTPAKDTSSFNAGGGGYAGLTGLDKQVHDLISSSTNEEGVSISMLRQKLKAVPEQKIRTAVETLSNEGHIYSTIDDEHYKSTDSFS